MFLLLDPKLDPRSAGTITVPEDELAAKLGHAAFIVWEVLTTRRDVDGVTHAKRVTISSAKGFEHLPDRVVKKALSRLHDSGLVVNLYQRRRRATLPSGERGWVFPRRVYGARAASPGSTTRLVVVPTTTYQWMKTVSGWGGARVGAGRKTGADTTFGGIQEGPYRKALEESTDSLTNQEGPMNPQTGGNSNSRGAIPTPSERIQEGPRINIYTLVRNQEKVGETLLRNVSPTRGAGAPRSGMQSDSSPGMEASLMLSKPATPNLGLHLGGTAPRPCLPQPGHMGVPSYPGPTVMPPAVVPRPPKLPEDLSDLDVAQWLAKSYRGAVEARYGERCYVLARRGELAKSRFMKVLVDGGRTLSDYDIAPAAWAAFSVEVWKRHESSKKPPPINWMFAPNRIEERREWFEEEEGAYNGGRVVYGEAAQDLMRRYVQMLGTLTWAKKTEVEVKKVVERFFPDGLYDRLLAVAREQARDDQRLLDEAVVRGEWVW